MTDLRVDYQLLDHIYAGLGRLAGEFEHIQAMQDGYNGAMGSAAIAACPPPLDAFAGLFVTLFDAVMSTFRWTSTKDTEATPP